MRIGFRTRSRVLALLCVLLLAQSAVFGTASGADGESGNLVANGGFEEGLWEAEGPISAELDAETKREGAFSAKVTATDGHQLLVSGLVPVDPKKAYRLSVWTKLEDIGKEDGVYVGVLEVRADNSAVGWYRSDRLLKTGGTHDWKELSAVLEGMNESTAYVKLYLRMDPDVQGTAWFDDVVLRPEQAEEAEVDVRIDSERHGNIFTTEEPLTAAVHVTNRMAEPLVGTVIVQAKDYWGRIVHREEIELAAAPGETTRSDVLIPEAAEGYFEVDAIVMQNGEAKASRMATFARVEPMEAAAVSSSSFFGAQTHFGQYRADPSVNIPLISAMGGKFIRDEMYWSEVEKEKGTFVYDPSFDRYVEEAAKEGIEPILILNYGNILYDKNPDTGYFRSPHTSEGLEAYARYVGETVSRYKGKISHYEVWNEPNGSQFWLAEPDAREYAAVLKAAYLAVKAVDPEAVVIAGAIAGTDLYFLEDLFEAGGLNYMDALSIHPYRGGSPERTKYLEDIERHRSLMLKYGQVKPIWITETGYPTTDEYYSDEQQAQYLVRMHVQSMASGIVRMINWYDFQDDGPDPHNHEHNFGLVHLDLTPKPSYAAYNAMVERLSGAVYLGQIPLAPDQYGYVFLKNGKTTAVLYGTSPSEVELAVSGQYTLTDMMGVERSGRAEGSLTVELKQEPVYLSTERTEPWAVQAVAHAADQDAARAKEIIGELVAEPAVQADLHRRIDRIAEAAQRGKFEQAAKETATFQSDVLSKSGKSLGEPAAYAISSFMSITLEKLTGAAALAGPALPEPAVRNQWNRIAKQVERAEAEARAKAGADGLLPDTEVWLQEAKERLDEASALLRQGDTVTASAILAYAEETAALAKRSASVESVVFPGVWTSLARYEWSGQNLVEVPVDVHNELENEVNVTLAVTAPEGFTAGSTSIALAPGGAGRALVVLDGSQVPAGRYEASIQATYRTSDGKQAASVPMNFTVRTVEPVEMTLQPISNGKATVIVTNLLDETVEGSFSATLPAQYESDTLQFDVAPLQPGESRAYDIPLRQVGTLPLNRYSIVLEGRFKDTLVAATLPMNFETVVRGSAVVDGSLDDWAAALPVHLNQESQVHMIKDWTPEKVSATIWTMWDEEHFYLAAKVRDNKFYNMYTGDEIWRGDGIQAAFDTLGDRTTSYNDDDYEYGFALTPAGTQAYRWAAAQGKTAGPAPSVQVAVTTDAEGDTVYEIAIPKDDIAPLPLRPGTSFGMNVLVNDNDEGDRLGWLEWSEGLGMFKDPSLFRIWTLQE